MNSEYGGVNRMSSAPLWWLEDQLIQARAKQRVHGIDTTKDQRRFEQLIEQHKGSNMSEAALKVVPDDEPKVEKVKKAKTAAGFVYTAKISLQTDPEGKQYGNDNNPKRAGSNAHKLFAIYKDGMTVGDAIAAGSRASALKYDLDHGYIKISVA
jgi:hypothetical protein